MIDTPPTGGTTGLSQELTAQIEQAARWLATASPAEKNKPSVVLLRERFGLLPKDAIAAIREAALIRARAD